MLKVHVRAPEKLGRGIHRVAAALERYLPADAVHVPRAEAELVVYHVIGLTGLRELLEEDRAAGRRYALIQYCLLTTEAPDPVTWRSIWSDAVATWSYYDLAQWLSHSLPGSYSESICPNFYYAPLGVDGDVFRPARPTRKRFLIGTSGYLADTEGVKECYEAARRLDRDQFHLGPNLELGTGVTYAVGITDEDVAALWSACTFVAGLRRIEGFELPALEGLACGARPVMFDAPHYRAWFGDHAEYVPETDAATVADALEAIFRRPARPVTASEREAVLARFDWRRLVAGFWEVIR